MSVENIALAKPENKVLSIKDKDIKPEVFKNTFDINKMLHTVGGLEFTEKECKVLYAPINPDELDITEHGNPYLPWGIAAVRLRTAFPGCWALLPQGDPVIDENNNMMWGFHFVIKKTLMDYIVSDHKYITGNRQQTHTDVIKSVKSKAILQACKGIGMFPELWNRQFIEKWKAEYADKKWNDKKNKYEYFLKETSKKFLYIKHIKYLFELIDASENKFLKMKGKVSLDLCTEEELSDYKTELENMIIKKMTGKDVKKTVSKSKDRNKMIVKINKMLDKKFDTAAQKTAFLKKYNVSDLNKVDIDILKKIGSELSKDIKVESGPRDKKPVKKEKDLTEYMKEFEGLTKQLKMSTDEINELTKDIGNDITVEGLKKLIKDMKIKLKDKGNK